MDGTKEYIYTSNTRRGFGRGGCCYEGGLEKEIARRIHAPGAKSGHCEVAKSYVHAFKNRARICLLRRLNPGRARWWKRGGGHAGWRLTRGGALFVRISRTL